MNKEIANRQRGEATGSKTDAVQHAHRKETLDTEIEGIEKTDNEMDRQTDRQKDGMEQAKGRGIKSERNRDKSTKNSDNNEWLGMTVDIRRTGGGVVAWSTAASLSRPFGANIQPT